MVEKAWKYIWSVPVMAAMGCLFIGMTFMTGPEEAVNLLSEIGFRVHDDLTEE